MAFIAASSTDRVRAGRQQRIRINIDRLDVYAMAERIMDVHALSTDEERAAGATWYEDARAHADRLARKHGVTLRQAVGIIAALSPGCSWDRNLVLAEHMLITADCSHPYGDAISKARRILQGEDPNLVLGGRKVRSFYRNILYPALPGPVTIDRHAMAICVATEQGKRGGSIIDPKELEGWGTYQLYALAYRIAARKLRYATPHQCQAVCWLTWRRLDFIPEF